MERKNAVLVMSSSQINKKVSVWEPKSETPTGIYAVVFNRLVRISKRDLPYFKNFKIIYK
jgi:hypothetical protein